MSAEQSIYNFLSLDADNAAHHARVLDRDGNKLFDILRPQLEAEDAATFHSLQQHGSVLIVVDQPTTTGALHIVVTHDCDRMVGFLPDFAVRKATEQCPKHARIDKHDFLVTVNTACTMPHTLRAVGRNDEGLCIKDIVTLRL